MGDIKSLGSKYIPLTLVDSANKVWFLGANIILQNGAVLTLYGDEAGGDVNELRLKSNNNSLSDYVRISGSWGNIDIRNTKITSWDEAVAGPDTDYSNGRAHINVRSFLASDGSTPLESRMDIKDSEVGYLGFYKAESYGLSWKVATKKLSVFDQVGVYGDVINNKIHDNFFGIYAYGGQGMNFTGNEVYDNIWYGMDPHDDSDYLVIDNNYVHHNGKHGIICSKRCDNITVVNNISSYNEGVGIFIHRLVNDSLIENNEAYYNADAGIALFDSYNNRISDNISKFNKIGLRLSVGSSNNIVENNELSQNLQYGIFTFKGTDTPLGSADGIVKSNTFKNNIMSKNVNAGIRFKEGNFNLFENNTIDNSYYSIYTHDTSENIFIKNTVFDNVRNYYFERVDSQNMVKDTPGFSFKLYDSLSDMMVVNSQNRLLWNSKGLATDFVSGESSVYVNKTKAGSSVVNVSETNLIINPSSGQLSAVRSVWNLTGDFRKKWTEKVIVSPPAADHVVGDLNPGSSYRALANGVLLGTYSANLNGEISFTYASYGSAGTQVIFEVKQ